MTRLHFELKDLFTGRVCAAGIRICRQPALADFPVALLTNV